MIYSKNILHLKPFIESVKSLVPFKRIKLIRGYKVNKNYNFIVYGSTIKRATKFSSINLLTHEYDDKIKKYRAVVLYTILDALSHELAHTVHWEHSEKHYYLQAKIQSKFSKVLKRLNIKDTEIRHDKIGSKNASK